MKIVRESLFEVIRSEDDWANQQIARNVDRYKDEIREEPISNDNQTSDSWETNEDRIKSYQMFKQFLMSEDLPAMIGSPNLPGVFNIHLMNEDEEYDILIIENSQGDNEAEYEFFQMFGPALKDLIGEGKFRNVQEIADSEGNPLFVK